MRNFGWPVKLDALSYTSSTYTGRAADAPWRNAAAERIEKIRKGDLTIAVTDAAGKPVPDAQVRVIQKKHAFGWGTAVDAGTESTEDTEGLKITKSWDRQVECPARPSVSSVVFLLPGNVRRLSCASVRRAASVRAQ